MRVLVFISVSCNWLYNSLSLLNNSIIHIPSLQFKLLYLIVAANRTAAQGFAATTFVEASRTLTMEVSIGAGCWDCKVNIVAFMSS